MDQQNENKWMNKWIHIKLLSRPPKIWGEMKGIEECRKLSKSAVKWSEVKCSDVRWNGTVGNLNGIKPNERVVKCTCSWVKFKWQEVKCR